MNTAFQVAIGISVVLFFIALKTFLSDSLQHGLRNIWSGGTGSQVTVATPAESGTATPPKAKSKPRTERHASREAVDPVSGKDDPPVVTYRVAVPVLPFPTAGDLKAGMSRGEIMSKFGPPSFMASWSNDGSLTQKFIYASDKQVTAVILRDGQMVTSRTEQYDPWVRSLWWQAGVKDKPAYSPPQSTDRD